MREYTARVLTFFLTLSIGLGIGFVCYTSIPKSNQDTVPELIETSSELKSVKEKDKSTEPWILKISACTEANSYNLSEGKGFIPRGVVNNWAICGTLPEYPQTAMDANISGVVTVNVLIDERGEVIEANGHLGNPLLLKSAEKAAYQTRFCPTQLGGEPYKVKGFLMYKFDIQRGTWLQDPIAPDNPFKQTLKPIHEKAILFKRL